MTGHIIISGAGLHTHRSPVIGHIIISGAGHWCILLGHSGRTLPALHTHTTVKMSNPPEEKNKLFMI